MRLWGPKMQPPSAGAAAAAAAAATVAAAAAAAAARAAAGAAAGAAVAGAAVGCGAGAAAGTPWLRPTADPRPSACIPTSPARDRTLTPGPPTHARRRPPNAVLCCA
ncbi:MAG: hypothetical protein J3K34DRAFT_415225 [Monoraphidium minutum]|nr:MAG: hypothetical protein J3K34DRAFT_415225 [Monoraphidium minutum]